MQISRLSRHIYNWSRARTDAEKREEERKREAAEKREEQLRCKRQRVEEHGNEASGLEELRASTSFAVDAHVGKAHAGQACGGLEIVQGPTVIAIAQFLLKRALASLPQLAAKDATITLVESLGKATKVKRGKKGESIVVSSDEEIEEEAAIDEEYEEGQCVSGGILPPAVSAKVMVDQARLSVVVGKRSVFAKLNVLRLGDPLEAPSVAHNCPVISDQAVDTDAPPFGMIVLPDPLYEGDCLVRRLTYRWARHHNDRLTYASWAWAPEAAAGMS
eukprot:jgi/Mesvir1/9172/Mv06913-RA.1